MLEIIEIAPLKLDKRKKLHLYAMFRDGVYNSYQKLNRPDDVKNFHAIFADDNKYDRLYHYAANASVRDLAYCLNPDKKMRLYCAFGQAESGRKELVGYCFFEEKIINGEASVYIGLLAVSHFKQGIGTGLMAKVLLNYKQDTHIWLMTRKFNTPACKLYENKLGFSAVPSDEIPKELSLGETPNWRENYAVYRGEGTRATPAPAPCGSVLGSAGLSQ